MFQKVSIFTQKDYLLLFLDFRMQNSNKIITQSSKYMREKTFKCSVLKYESSKLLYSLK